jgi:hypothetical protein
MTSPFEIAEIVGGPWDGATFERRGEAFPDNLPLPRNGVLFLYVAGIGRLGNPVYRFMGRFDFTMEVVR